MREEMKWFIPSYLTFSTSYPLSSLLSFCTCLWHTLWFPWYAFVLILSSPFPPNHVIFFPIPSYPILSYPILLSSSLLFSSLPFSTILSTYYDNPFLFNFIRIYPIMFSSMSPPASGLCVLSCDNGSILSQKQSTYILKR